MKARKISFVLMVGCVAIGASRVCQAAEAPVIAWGKDVQSAALDGNELRKMRAIFPVWKAKQVVWPSDAEIAVNSVDVPDKPRVSCVGWVRRFLNKQYVPTDLGKHLVAMNDWGLVKNQSDQERLCDVFIARFRKEATVIHTQESPSNLVIAIVDESLPKDRKTDHTELVVSAAGALLHEELRAKADSDNFRVHGRMGGRGKITRMSWVLESVAVTDEQGRKLINLAKAAKIGAKRVTAETDGRFIRFEIVKCMKGPRAFPDPYVDRFKLPKPKSVSSEAK